MNLVGTGNGCSVEGFQFAFEEPRSWVYISRLNGSILNPVSELQLVLFLT